MTKEEAKARVEQLRKDLEPCVAAGDDWAQELDDALEAIVEDFDDKEDESGDEAAAE